MNATKGVSANIMARLARLGIGGGQQTKVTLNFDEVRTYGSQPVRLGNLPKAELEYLLANGHCAILLDWINAMAREKWAHVASEEQTNLLADRRIRFVVVTRVYLANSISYTYSDERILHGLLGSDVAQQDRDAWLKALASLDVSTMDDGSAEAVRAMLSKLLTANSAGSASQSSIGVGMNQSFERPVAIAYESMLFRPGEIDACSRKDS